jgi:hypothetical protein
MSENTKESAGAKNTVVNEDSNDWDVWHGACAKNASRSDDKVKKVAANNKELLLANMKALFDLAKRVPRVHQSELMSPVRDYYGFIMSNPEACPMSNRPSISTTQQQAMPELTEGLVQALSSNGKYSGVAIVKVIETSTKFRSQDFNRATTKIPLTTLTCIDGSGQPITVKCASQLNSTAGILVTGTVMKITKFQPVFFTLSAADRTKVALVLCGYESLGVVALSDDEKHAFKNRVEVTLDDQRSHNEEQMPETELDSEDHFSDLPEIVDCSEDNRLCNSGGVFFANTCVCDAMPVEQQLLDEIAGQCWFVDRTVADMTDKQKRSLLYWWYATNIYGVFGSKNRIKLPDCLVWRIRKQHPSPTGNYVGHKAAKRNSKKRVRHESNS